MSEETVENGIKRNNDGTFAQGTAPGPGRPEETPEQVITKRAIKELVKEYKEDLAQVLPQVKPVLIKKAIEGDMTAIKEIHDRVMDKAKQPTSLTGDEDNIVPILVKFIDERTNNNSGNTQ